MRWEQRDRRVLCHHWRRGGTRHRHRTGTALLFGDRQGRRIGVHTGTACQQAHGKDTSGHSGTYEVHRGVPFYLCTTVGFVWKLTFSAKLSVTGVASFTVSVGETFNSRRTIPCALCPRLCAVSWAN